MVLPEADGPAVIQPVHAVVGPQPVQPEVQPVHAAVGPAVIQPVHAVVGPQPAVDLPI